MIADKSAQTQAPANTDSNLLHLKIYSPFQVYFNDEAYSISGENATGPFDILGQHHNFMTLLKEGELLIKSPKGEKIIKILRGVMHVKNNKVIVFLDV